ncbi:MAG: ABC transporter substrate-binding protein [Rhodovibrionaceae bacterium]|nr:ABC transporter substrate-binding protein [Rhodovibrionaceae bacterium]
MRLKTKLAAAAVGAAMLASPLLAAVPAQAEGEQFMPLLVYRTGPYAPNGIPIADGFIDYFRLVNERDGGINGVKVAWEECETQYNNDRGVECYERLKSKGDTGATVFSPYSTGITYALIERATADKIPILSMGYGRADASYGKVFPYVFTMPATYWAGADAMIQYIKEQEGGSLEGKKVALVYHDSAYGKEPIRTLERLAEEEGYSYHGFPVAHPGLEQKATWLQIGRQLRPDWVLMWGWGVMNSTAVKEAAAVGYPMERFIGIWWSGAEPDVKPAGNAAIGYKSAQITGPGDEYPIYDDLNRLNSEGKLASDGSNLGTVLYNRALVNAMLQVEAVRTAQEKYGNKPLTGEQVQWGFENLNLTAERIKELGMEGMVAPIKITCADHEGGGKVLIQQWDGKDWQFVSDYIDPRRDALRKAYKESALQYAEEKGIEPRSCE